ncbi:hypothetical protein E2C01_099722 [Portunus trituberculatus]|uniref:Uncharacterized protein n=1 Tax=Portunus trituberculatus TaxID=210409 RepID=A0A5B7K688_PORTR|nr:hypothetical protein [Portunus trituberculatus]
MKVSMRARRTPPHTSARMTHATHQPPGHRPPPLPPPSTPISHTSPTTEPALLTTPPPPLSPGARRTGRGSACPFSSTTRGSGRAMGGSR